MKSCTVYNYVTLLIEYIYLGILQVLSSHSTKLALRYKAVKLMLQICICMQV